MIAALKNPGKKRKSILIKKSQKSKKIPLEEKKLIQ
jgi:hypothetical protein